MAKIISVAYSTPKKFIDRFFKDGKNVFVKPATVW